MWRRLGLRFEVLKRCISARSPPLNPRNDQAPAERGARRLGFRLISRLEGGSAQLGGNPVDFHTHDVAPKRKVPKAAREGKRPALGLSSARRGGFALNPVHP